MLCGTTWVDETFWLLDPAIQLKWHARDGDAVKATQLLLEIHGHARGVLSGERTALNFLQTLSGTATTTRRFRATT